MEPQNQKERENNGAVGKRGLGRQTSSPVALASRSTLGTGASAPTGPGLKGHRQSRLQSKGRRAARCARARDNADTWRWAWPAGPVGAGRLDGPGCSPRGPSFATPGAHRSPPPSLLRMRREPPAAEARRGRTRGRTRVPTRGLPHRPHLRKRVHRGRSLGRTRLRWKRRR